MIGCAEAIKQLWEYLDGTVDDSDRAAIEQHLSVCLQCCGELEFAEHLRLLLRDSAHAEIPDDVRARLHSTLNELGRA
jgi:mycothiol system anti-sigma-R factor